MDILFVVDSSGSIGTVYEKQKVLYRYITNRYLGLSLVYPWQCQSAGTVP